MAVRFKERNFLCHDRILATLALIGVMNKEHPGYRTHSEITPVKNGSSDLMDRLVPLPAVW